jgi:hypothetical protein
MGKIMPYPVQENKYPVFNPNNGHQVHGHPDKPGKKSA